GGHTRPAFACAAATATRTNAARISRVAFTGPASHRRSSRSIEVERRPGFGDIARPMAGSQTSPTASLGLLFMRIGAGALLIYGHGWPKLTHFTERAGRFADPLHIGNERSMMLAVFAECVCAAAVILGFATRFAAAVLVIFFTIIVSMVHRGAPFS